MKIRFPECGRSGRSNHTVILTHLIIILEEGGTMFTFEGTRKKCFLKSVLRVYNPQFYWKVMTQDDLGLADAYINGAAELAEKRVTDARLQDHIKFLLCDYRQLPKTSKGMKISCNN